MSVVEQNLSNRKLVVSSFKIIGDDVKVNRNRLTVFSQKIAQYNSSHIQDKVLEIFSDKCITPSEKTSLKSMIESITASFNIASNDAETYNLKTSSEYIAYKESYDSLKALSDDILLDMDTTYYYSGTASASDLVNLYYSTAQVMSSKINAVANSLSDEAYENSVTRISISASTTQLGDSDSAVLSAKLERLGVDVTADYADSCFSWLITGTSDDALWNTQHTGMKSISVPCSIIGDAGIQVSAAFSFEG